MLFAQSRFREVIEYESDNFYLVYSSFDIFFLIFE